MEASDIKKLLDARLSRERAKELLIELVKVPSPQTDLLEEEPLLKEFIKKAIEPRLRTMGFADIRYDAMGELSGQQSSTMALLDAHRTGVVVSSILHRDQARVYVKQVREGESELELSPEEHEAIEAAMAGAPART